jgi:hypothetical protein
MNSSLLLLLSAIMAPWLGPNIRIDHNDIPTNWVQSPAITLGPQTSSGQPVYVAFQKDSLLPSGFANSASIMFQKSTDGGRTWLPQDVLVQRGSPLAEWPDIVTDSEGNIYIVYENNSDSAAYCYDCVRSSDGGSTWSTPVSIHSRAYGWARIAVDSADNLFAAWTEGHVYSSVSTDKGTTWSPRVRVDDDTVKVECYYADAYVQPGTNHYLVVASAPYHHSGGYVSFHSYFYRSTDMGRTFEPGVQLDSLGGAFEPHVVADAQHIICDYTGKSEFPSRLVTESRTCYAPSDTWGSRVDIAELDPSCDMYYDGSKLAISADGHVHTALMIGNVDSAPYLAYYAYSSDHGASWSDRMLVSADTTVDAWDEDIAADSVGHAYIVWQKNPPHGQIWFATNNPVAIAEQTQDPDFTQPMATVVRNVLFLPEAASCKPQAASLLDISGREVMGLKPGANDVRALVPGVYFLREGGVSREQGGAAIRKVVIAR